MVPAGGGRHEIHSPVELEDGPDRDQTSVAPAVTETAVHRPVPADVPDAPVSGPEPDRDRPAGTKVDAAADDAAVDDAAVDDAAAADAAADDVGDEDVVDEREAADEPADEPTPDDQASERAKVQVISIPEHADQEIDLRDRTTTRR
jgi:hypothetical protein